MTAKEFLSQGYRLEQKIRLAKLEIENLKELSGSIGSPGYEEHYNPNRPSEAPFVQTFMKIMELEEKVDKELKHLIGIREEIKMVIGEVADTDEQLVLMYRYIHNLTWANIADEMHADERTVRRWHNKALSHVIVPPITFDD
ncbi:MAG: DUF1492 domain-containing protein [Acetivibrio ethanolgignens]